MPLLDAFNRPLDTLRISVTDRCNLRCTYCMPREVFGSHHVFLPRQAILTFEEITRLAGIFTDLGVRHIRLTGGEPLLRKNLPELIRAIRQQTAVEDLALTTNGMQLAHHVRDLADAGLGRLTVSMDALDDPTFRKCADTEASVARVLEGIQAAEDAGFTHLKINCVVQHKLNAHAILPLAEHFRGTGHTVRFIEYMDVGNTNGWQHDDVLSARQMIETIHAAHPLEPVDDPALGRVAKRWRYLDGAGEIGVIASVSEPFCNGCTRGRLSTDGQFFNCLFAETGHDLRQPLRDGISDDDLKTLIENIWHQRNDRYSEKRAEFTHLTHRKEMSYLGG